ncbi:hypothetical protein HOE37_03490 [Candidatus Woesearchaeota archaeon]|jgi:DNA-directed RNA polymerase subunit M/transcription elongation factor TFIIS|nr:hypothetical protein [Candidatus Woesearchaeota archaeon]MBT4110894.1 hypothetical protein [Candidatus Woesearchaeota archaeon]MBT4336594.1 hypothetical protein [Candidatus Woesearchaeota archaeon]MBT4469657.1 hypothetical protein [Candidatus Woesearchaeota archaeon]MBT6744019.1 hypothetical protein [Candidatus Woesearchaeota archaeon]
MGFKAKKSYGNYKRAMCPFCNGVATQKNEQGIDVCRMHTKSVLQDFKCTCGSWLEPRAGKFGTYFNCINCGNVNQSKALEIKTITTKNKIEDVLEDKPKPTFSNQTSTFRKERKVIEITTDDVEYFD